jgi:hypothetical protein
MQSDGPFGELIKLPQLLRQQLLLVFDLLCPPRTGKVICINPQTRFEAIGLLLRFIFNSLNSSSCILEAISQLQLSKELRKRLLNISAPTPAVEQDPAILISRLSSYFLSDNLFSADAARLMWDLTAHAFSCHQLPELERPSWISK